MKLVDPKWRWFWGTSKWVLPLWSKGPVEFDLVSGREFEMFDHSASAIAPIDWGVGALGPCFDTQDPDDLVLPPAAEAAEPPLDQVTICVILEKKDATDRASGAFGNNASPGLTERCQMHAPYSDGNYYWDFGGATSGTSRLTITAPDTAGIRVMVMTAGPAGMSIWQNGLKLGSHATASPGRIAYVTGGSVLNRSNTADKGDNAKYYHWSVHDKQWTDSQIIAWSQDPFGPITMIDSVPVLAAVGGIVELAAVLAATSDVVSSLSVTRSLNAIIAATGGLTPALQLINGLYAALSSTGAIAANLDSQSGLYSAIAATSDIFGEIVLTGVVDLAAVIAAVSAYQSELDAQPGLYSSIAATSTINAKINTITDLDSLIASVSTVSGKIGCIVNINGTILGTSTVAGAVSLIRSLDSLLPATSTVGGELGRIAGLAVVIPGVSTILADIFTAIVDTRGFVTLNNAEQYHLSHSNVSQYHVSKSDVSQYHVGVANEYP